jgi:hypothetical protein
MIWVNVEKRKLLSKNRFGITLEDDDGNVMAPKPGTILTAGTESYLVQPHKPEDEEYISVKSTNNKFPGKRLLIT